MATLHLISSERRRPADLRRHVLEMGVRRFRDLDNPALIEDAILPTADPELVMQLPDPRAILSIAAGVDHIVRDLELPEGIPFARTHDASQDPRRCIVNRRPGRDVRLRAAR